MLDEMQLIFMSTAEMCSENCLITHPQPIHGNIILEPTLNEKSGQKCR